MLTQEQKDQLTQLMNDCSIPKLKKVLDEGLPRFISGEIKPIQNNWGVITNNQNIYFAPSKESCLLGSALIGKNQNEEFSFNFDELTSIVGSFDNRHFRPNYNKEIYDYVAKIRQVIFEC